jgi:uncharacterized repeat protein (TIGR03803 family)
MPAQNSVPPTAVQAARMPGFASRLAHPAPQSTSRPNPAPALQGSRGGPPQGNDIYDNGPINGNAYAWSINFGSVVSDTFTMTGGGGSVNGMTFGAWLFPGDTLTSAELSITSSENGGTSYFDQTVNFTQSDCTQLNDFGYTVCTASATFNGPMLNLGTYWVNLQNAVTTEGEPVYWDENSGVGCTGSGCPSQASENSVGTIPSESFTMLGEGGSPTCFESEGNLQIISNFTQQQEGTYNYQAGVTIDHAGNLYGTTYNGGNNSAGFAFRLAHFAGWLLDPLFSFFGGNNGGQPTGAIIGPNGTLYGGAQGGIQNCGTGGSQYCGLVFNLTPQPRACASALCSWNENVPYRFSSEIDGTGTINVSAFDQEGNLYGTTSTGGAYDAGTVFELTRSGGGWTKTSLYAFTGGNDGSGPTQVLVGNDGNLYGVASGGIYNNGVVFQLTLSGGRWTESVLHAFNDTDGSEPGYLVQDSAGNLYGITPSSASLHGVIFTLQKTSSGWGFSEYMVDHHNEFEVLNNLAIDAAGNLYGTGYDGSMFAGGRRNIGPGGGTTHDSYIFQASYAGGGWNYEDLDYLDSQYLDSGGTLALDASRNLYGTTRDCGTNGYGTVWQFSP